MAGVIDPDYRGEILIVVYNYGNDPFIVEKGMKIAQLILEKHDTPPLQVVSELSSTDRNDRGFGSTDVVGNTPMPLHNSKSRSSNTPVSMSDTDKRTDQSFFPNVISDDEEEDIEVNNVLNEEERTL